MKKARSMVRSHDFDESLALEMVDALDDVRRRMAAECHLVAQELGRLTAWSGVARDLWTTQMDSCLADGLEVVQLLAATTDTIRRRHERWMFETSLMGEDVTGQGTAEALGGPS